MREHALGVGVRAAGRVHALDGARKAEVEHLHGARRGDHHVGGLQVAMHDALHVGGGDGVGQGHGDVEEGRRRQGPGGQHRGQAATLDKLHGQEMQAVHLFHRVDDHDAGMVQRGEGAGFAPEEGKLLRIGGHLRRQHLQRDPSPQLEVLGGKDLPHPARAQLLDDPVTSQRLADHGTPPGSRGNTITTVRSVRLLRGAITRKGRSSSPPAISPARALPRARWGRNPSGRGAGHGRGGHCRP